MLWLAWLIECMVHKGYMQATLSVAPLQQHTKYMESNFEHAQSPRGVLTCQCVFYPRLSCKAPFGSSCLVPISQGSLVASPFQTKAFHGKLLQILFHGPPIPLVRLCFSKCPGSSSKIMVAWSSLARAEG